MRTRLPESAAGRSGAYPRWLYLLSVAWSGLLGVVVYAAGTLPVWLTYDFFERSERGPFWDPPNLVLDVGVMAGLGAVVFRVVLSRGVKRRLVWTYVAAAEALSACLLLVGIAWWYATTPIAYPGLAGLLLVIHGLPISVAAAVYGAISGWAIGAACRATGARTGREARAGDGRPGVRG